MHNYSGYIFIVNNIFQMDNENIIVLIKPAGNADETPSKKILLLLF